MLRSLTGPEHSDESDDIEMDEDNQRDFGDCNYQLQENDEDSEDFYLNHLVQVLVDSMEFTADELELAVHSVTAAPSPDRVHAGPSCRTVICIANGSPVTLDSNVQLVAYIRATVGVANQSTFGNEEPNESSTRSGMVREETRAAGAR